MVHRFSSLVFLHIDARLENSYYIEESIAAAGVALGVDDGSGVNQVKLKTKFGVLMLALFVVAIVGNAIWNYCSERDQMVSELHEKGHVLSQQMSAVWDFMSANQD